jgi:thiol-disulfide isomerase/thioredoxin
MNELKQQPTLVYFSAPWCAPCKAMGPVVEQVTGKLNIGVQKINVDDEPELAEKYGVRAVPTLVLEDREAGSGPNGQAGVEMLRVVGAKNAAALEVQIEQALKGS